MKTLKNLVPVFAIMLGLGLVFTQSAFKSTKGDDLMYQYSQADDQRIADYTAWDDVTNSPGESCGEVTVLPCVIQFNTSEYADLAAYLTAHPDATSINEDKDHLVSQKDGIIEP